LSAPVQAASLIVGTLGINPNSDIKKMLPFANYLASHLQADGIDQGKVRIEKNILPIAQALRKKRMDLYIGNPFTSVALNRLTGMRFLLQASSQGAEKHSSVIFVRNNSSIKYLKDLRGKVIAFENPLSAFGYLLPKWLLIERGFKLKFLKKITEAVSSEEIAYLFSKDDQNTLLWVKKEKVEAGAIDYETYKNQAKESLAQLRIIEKTAPLPPLLISCRSELSPELIKHLKEILKKMPDTDEGKIILTNLDEISKFQEISQAYLSPMLKLDGFLNSELKY